MRRVTLIMIAAGLVVTMACDDVSYRGSESVVEAELPREEPTPPQTEGPAETPADVRPQGLHPGPCTIEYKEGQVNLGLTFQKWTYDAAGRVSLIEDDRERDGSIDATHAFFYNEAGRLVSSHRVDTPEFPEDIHSDKHPFYGSFIGGDEYDYNYGYDDAGRLAYVAISMPHLDVEVTFFDYDAEGRPTDITRTDPNLEEATDARRFTYDDEGKIAVMTYMSPGAGLFYTWGYDPAGNPDRFSADDVLRNDADRIFNVYDSHQRIVRAESYHSQGVPGRTETWSYDDAGNVLSWALYYGPERGDIESQSDAYRLYDYSCWE